MLPPFPGYRTAVALAALVLFGAALAAPKSAFVLALSAATLGGVSALAFGASEPSAATPLVLFGYFAGASLKDLYDTHPPVRRPPLLLPLRAFAAVSAVSGAAAFVGLRTSYLLARGVRPPFAVNVLGEDASQVLPGVLGALLPLLVAAGVHRIAARFVAEARSAVLDRALLASAASRRRRRAASEDRRASAPALAAVGRVAPGAEHVHRPVGGGRRRRASDRPAARPRGHGRRRAPASRVGGRGRASRGPRRCGLPRGPRRHRHGDARLRPLGTHAPRRGRKRRRPAARGRNDRSPRDPLGARPRGGALVAESRGRPFRSSRPARGAVPHAADAVRGNPGPPPPVRGGVGGVSCASGRGHRAGRVPHRVSRSRLEGARPHRAHDRPPAVPLSRNARGIRPRGRVAARPPPARRDSLRGPRPRRSRATPTTTRPSYAPRPRRR